MKTKPRTRQYAENRTVLRAKDVAPLLMAAAEKGENVADSELETRGTLPLGFRLLASPENMLGYRYVYRALGKKRQRWRKKIALGTVDVVMVPCRFGGVRWFFLCPITHKRVTTLYLDKKRKRFVSMQAAGLSYRSQSLNEKGRLKRRLRKIERRIGNDWSVKPKGMQHVTFDRLTAHGVTVLSRLDEIREAEEEKQNRRFLNLCRRNNWL